MLDLVQKRADEIVAKLAKLGLPKVEFSVELADLKSGVAGDANFYFKRVRISKDYLKEHTKEILDTTVPHEVCHIYVAKYFPFAKQAHGPEFRRMMAKLGCDGSTRHSMARPAAQGPRRTKTVTRHIYLTEHTKREVLLTVQQHKKQQEFAAAYGKSRFTSKGEPLVATGKIRKFK